MTPRPSRAQMQRHLDEILRRLRESRSPVAVLVLHPNTIEAVFERAYNAADWCFRRELYLYVTKKVPEGEAYFAMKDVWHEGKDAIEAMLVDAARQRAAGQRRPGLDLGLLQ